MDADDKITRSLDVGRVFTPATPVNEKDLFAGRIAQIRKVVDTINQAGQHAILFGDRGVGKTSLANVLHAWLKPDDVLVAPRINCDSTDTFTSLWKKVFSEIDLMAKARGTGFNASEYLESQNAADVIGDDISPDDVRRMLTLLSSGKIVIIIVDEFDRLATNELRRAIADTIKMLSDHAVEATLVLVGVADSVDELIAEHQSIERALVQVQMPRMSGAEIQEILDKGMERLAMTMHLETKQLIRILSQGLPHYAHLLALHATRAAIDADSNEVMPDHLEAAINAAVEAAQHSLRSAYTQAVASSRSDSIYREVLLACALAKGDELGCFAAADVRGPLSVVMNKPYDIPGFSKHLRDFSDEAKGNILHRTGIKHKHRFRFKNPLMPSLIVMKGLVKQRIDVAKLGELRSEN